MSILPAPAGRSIPVPAPGAFTRMAEAVARLIGGRIFNGHGAGYEATLTITSGWEGVPAFAPGVEHRAIVRLSRATGIPGPLPDAEGFALRLTNLYGIGRHQDFLLASSSRGPLLQHLVLPSVHERQPYSSLIPYSIGEDIRVLGALRDGPDSYRLVVAPLAGGWTPVGDLRLGARLPSELSAALTFSLRNYGEGLKPLAAAPARGW